MKHNPQSERAGKRARVSPSLLQRVQPDAVGIDRGQNGHLVAVLPER